MKRARANSEFFKKITSVVAIYILSFVAIATLKAQQIAPEFDKEAYSRLCQCVQEGGDIHSLTTSTPLTIAYLLTAAQEKRLRPRVLPLIYHLLEETPDALLVLIRIAATPDLNSYEAAKILGKLECANHIAIERAIDLLGDKSESVRVYAAKALQKTVAVTPLIKAIKDNADNNCLAIIDILGRLGSKAAPAIATLVAMLEKENPNAKAAIVALGQIGIADRDAVVRLLEILRGESKFRIIAAISLGQMKASSAIPALVKALSHKDKSLQANARWALAQIGKNSAIAMSKLLKGNFPGLKMQACLVLGKIGSEATVAMPELLQALRCSYPKVRGAAAWAIVMVGANKQSINAVIEALADKDRYVRENAIRALSSLCTSPLAVAALLKALNSPVVRKRTNAAWILGNMRIERKKIANNLGRLLKDQTPQMRSNAVYSLGKLEIKDDKLLAAMTSLLDDPERQVRKRAISALISSGKPAVSHLLNAFSSDKKQLRYGASCALCEMGTLAYQALPEFVKALNDSDLRVRCNAAVALGRLGILARGTITPLIESLKDPAAEMRMCTAWTLGLLALFEQDSVENALLIARDKEKNHKTRQLIDRILQKIAAGKRLDNSIPNK